MSLTQVITLAPPLLPFYLLFIANLILKQSFPKGMPEAGFCSNKSSKLPYSFFNEGYFFDNSFNSLSKEGIVLRL